MTKEEILKQIEKLRETNRRVEKNAEELRKQVENLPDDEKQTRTLPIDDEKYFFINESLVCDFGANYPELFDMGTNKENSSIGNYFKSKEDAEMVIRAIRLEQAIRIRRIELNDGWEPDWNDENETKYLISKFFDFITSGTTHLYDISPVFGYYKSQEITQQVIDEFEDDLRWYFIKYYPNKDKMYVWGQNDD